eukprot:m.8852 g.8852  ORF g.8852 m.8852 type:complete len:306 (+) comp20908_c0_seq1:415-1332(+)
MAMTWSCLVVAAFVGVVSGAVIPYPPFPVATAAAVGEGEHPSSAVSEERKPSDFPTTVTSPSAEEMNSSGVEADIAETSEPSLTIDSKNTSWQNRCSAADFSNQTKELANAVNVEEIMETVWTHENDLESIRLGNQTIERHTFFTNVWLCLPGVVLAEKYAQDKDLYSNLTVTLFTFRKLLENMPFTNSTYRNVFQNVTDKMRRKLDNALEKLKMLRLKCFDRKFQKKAIAEERILAKPNEAVRRLFSFLKVVDFEAGVHGITWCQNAEVNPDKTIVDPFVVDFTIFRSILSYLNNFQRMLNPED